MVFSFAEGANLFVMCGIAAGLFLGGSQLPFVAPGAESSTLGVELLGSLVFVGKIWALVATVVWCRSVLPSVRIDRLTGLCWRWLVPASLGAFALTGGWVLWGPSLPLQTVVGATMFLLSCVLAAHFAQRVRYNLRHPQTDARLNPFL